MSRYKLFVMDVDGTLTDGKIYMSEEGEVFKAFNVKDGYAIKHILPKLGILPVIITGRKSEIVEKRAEELAIEYLYQGVNDKLSLLRQLIEKFGCSFEQVVYVGDDINDIPCMEGVGLAACTADAALEVKRTCHYVCTNNGGNGAVREVIDLIATEKEYQ